MNVTEERTLVHITWRGDDEEDVRRARELFEKYTKQAWVATKKDGEFKRILEFRPNYEDLWFFPIVDAG